MPVTRSIEEVLGSQNYGLMFPTIAALQAATIPSTVQRVTVLGYYSMFDGGGHTRKRGSNVTAAIASTGGIYWEYVADSNRYDIRHFGAKVDGTTDDTAAINLAISALPKISGSFSTASVPQLYFPSGRTITTGGHVIPSDKKVKIKGEGNYNSLIYVKSGTDLSTDVLTINSTASEVEGVCIDGNRFATTATTNGDLLTVAASFVRVQSVRLINGIGDGLSVGKGGTNGINGYFAAIDVRYCAGYGSIVAGTSTDCTWIGVNVGANGKSGFRINTGAQKMHGCHAWGNGVENGSTDAAGFYVASGSNMFSGCESETNNGEGVRIPSNIRNNSWVGGSIWGNWKNAVNIYGGANHNNFTGVEMRNNNLSNAASGSSSATHSAILVDGSQYNNFTGCTSYDDGSAINAGSYTWTPAFPFAGRSAATYSQSAHYAELSGSDNNVIVGNTFRASQTRSGKAFVNVGVHNIYANNFTGLTTISSLASAATFTMPADADIISVTGTTNISTITAATQNRRITLSFVSAGCTIDTAGNVKGIGSGYTSTAGSTISFICDGTNWYKI